MSEVKRYTFRELAHQTQLGTEGYVLATDYDALLAERDAARVMRVELEKALDDLKDRLNKPCPGCGL